MDHKLYIDGVEVNPDTQSGTISFPQGHTGNSIHAGTMPVTIAPYYPTNPEMVVASDVDDTLVMWHQTEGNDVYIKDPHDGKNVFLKKHKKHIKLLQDYKARGYYVIVWSGNGKAWADAVVDALGIRQYVDETLSKPVKIIDDLPVQEWMGGRVYLEDK